MRILSEDVFVSGLKGKKAKLSYNKRASDAAIRNKGNYTSADMVNTGKMDQDNADTYIVPLKGGIQSYNITSIRGVEVMHYFKNKWDRKTTNINIEVNGDKKEYELWMDDPEFQNFLKIFAGKVSKVVNHYSKELAKKDKDFAGFKGVSIYPVPSSSRFNETMAEKLEFFNIGISGLPCRKINTAIFKKDLSDLEKDNDFINKNKEYYQGRQYKSGDDERTHLDAINDTLRKYGNTTAAQSQELVDKYNALVDKTITSYRNKVSQKAITKNYESLVAAAKEIRKKLGRGNWENAFKYKKYTKGPSIDDRTRNIHAIVAAEKGKTWVSQNYIPLVNIEPLKFQIKKLTNDVRLGLKNYFKAQEGIEEELARIEGTVFVIFDDNISGGATLSDI